MEPEAVIANQTPPLPWPFACPAALSPEYVYIGHPMYVSCLPPSGLATVPSVPVTPEPAAGNEPLTIIGGQVLAQLPVHVG